MIVAHNVENSFGGDDDICKGNLDSPEVYEEQDKRQAEQSKQENREDVDSNMLSASTPEKVHADENNSQEQQRLNLPSRGRLTQF